MSALLELGAGFHPELTGPRERLPQRGDPRASARRTSTPRSTRSSSSPASGSSSTRPVKIYSSGMYVRLGFSVAVHVDPEILIIDEVIAVGDEEFQRRCFDHLYRLRSQGVTIVIGHPQPRPRADACATRSPGSTTATLRAHRRRARRRPPVPRRGQRGRGRAHRAAGPRPRPQAEVRSAHDRSRSTRSSSSTTTAARHQGRRPPGAAHGADRTGRAREPGRAAAVLVRGRETRPACTWPTPACRPATTRASCSPDRATSTTPSTPWRSAPAQYTFSVAGARPLTASPCSTSASASLTLRVQPGRSMVYGLVDMLGQLGAAGERRRGPDMSGRRGERRPAGGPRSADAAPAPPSSVSPRPGRRPAP